MLPPMTHAQGVFLGCDLGLDPTRYSNDDYRRELGWKIALDIAHLFK